jgi:hypothetical protein
MSTLDQHAGVCLRALRHRQVAPRCAGGGGGERRNLDMSLHVALSVSPPIMRIVLLRCILSAFLKRLQLLLQLLDSCCRLVKLLLQLCPFCLRPEQRHQSDCNQCSKGQNPVHGFTWSERKSTEIYLQLLDITRPLAAQACGCRIHSFAHTDDIRVGCLGSTGPMNVVASFVGSLAALRQVIKIFKCCLAMFTSLQQVA